MPARSLAPFRSLLPLLLLAVSAAAVLAATGDRYFWPPVAPVAVKVDGSLKDWANLGTPVVISPTQVPQGYVNGTFTGDADCSARLRVAWDASRLYLALSVTDNSVRPLEAKSKVPGKFWEQDGLGFYLDAPGVNVASGRYQTKPTRPWQQEPILQLTPSKERWGQEVLPAGSEWGCSLVAKGYDVEASVPWSALGWRPQSGDRLFFSVILADIDRGPDGKDGPLHQLIWHQGAVETRPAGRLYGGARLVNAGGYGADLLVGSSVVRQGDAVAWRLLADSSKPGWTVSSVALRGPDATTTLRPGPAPVQPAQRLDLSGSLDTAPLKPGLYALEATAVTPGQTQKSEQPLQIVDEITFRESKSSPLPARQLVADPLRSLYSAERSTPPHQPLTHADYTAFVQKEIEAGWPGFEYHLRNKTLSLGGSWYLEYGLRHAAWAKVTGDAVWIDRAQQLFEMADAAFKANNYSGLGWINMPLIYYYKQYLTAVNAWKPEYDGIVKDWYLHTYPGYPASPKDVWLGMNNWGLSSGIRGVMGQYWLGAQLPDRAKWEKHIADTWGLFLNDVKDIDENTTNYAPWDLWLILLYLDQNNLTDRLRTDDGLRYLYERYLYEISPSGGRPQYGATNGWHDAPGIWMYLFERVGQILGDGRYKQQARLIWDYCLRHVDEWHQYHLVIDQTITFLARLLAEVPDDSLPAVPIEPKPILTMRGAMRILPPAEREQRNMFVETSAQRVPNKLIFRGSNDPGSLWAMIELNNDAGHCPARPSSVNCLMAKETVLLSDQSYMENDPQFHNMVFIEDLEGTQPVLGDMDITVPVLEDYPSVTYAVNEIQRYMRWPCTLRRHFLFAKDRFLWVRDELKFDSSFFARIGPCWLSRQMYSNGPDWFNTYFDLMPYTGLGQGGGLHRWKNYNYDLLTYCVPRKGMDFTMTDYTLQNIFMNAPTCIRQTWRGLTDPATPLVFDTILLPHPVKYNVIDASWVGSTFSTLAQAPGQTAVQFELPWQKEKVVLVTSDKPYEGGGLSTDARWAMVVWRDGQVANWFVREGTRLKAGDQTLFTSQTPGNMAK